MQAKLPTIDISRIGDSKLSEQLRQLLNFVEWQAQQITKLTSALEQANREIARLKGQPKKPHFPKAKKGSISVTALLSEKDKVWKKKAKDVPIDEEVTIPDIEECACGSHEFRTIRTETKVVQGMLLRRNNIVYRGRRRQCVTCGKVYKPTFPQETKGVSFDTTIQTLASQLKFDGRFSHLLLHRFFRGLGIQISYGEITELLKRNSKKLAPVYTHLRRVGIKQATFLQSDATGTKRRLRNGKVISQHMNVLGHKFLSIFKITRRYNAAAMNKLLGIQGQRKPLVSDDGSPNNACRCNGQQLCWVHEIRLYKKLFPVFNVYQEQQKHILSQWKEFYHRAKAYGADPPKTATSTIKQIIETMFDAITTQLTGYSDLDKQLRLSRKKREKLLFFLDHPALPIHNNQCEVDLREYVIIRKISGATNSVAGDRSIERHLSVIQTAKKQGLPVFQTLHGLLIGQLSPAILTTKTV